MNGCYTIKINYVNQDIKPVEKDYEIINVLLKDGRNINLEDIDSKFVKDNDGKYNAVVYFSNNIQQRIDFKDISSVKIEIVELRVIPTIIIAVAVPLILLGTAVMVILIGMGNMH